MQKEKNYELQRVYKFNSLLLLLLYLVVVKNNIAKNMNFALRISIYFFFKLKIYIYYLLLKEDER